MASKVFHYSAALTRHRSGATGSSPSEIVSHRTAYRASLWAVAGLACLAALAISHPEGHLQHDAELARLLRGMAWIKATFVAAGLATLYWRFGHPISPRAVAGYLGSVAAVVFSGALLLGLAHIAMAALVFHVGWIAGFAVAAFERR